MATIRSCCFDPESEPRKRREPREPRASTARPPRANATRDSTGVEPAAAEPQDGSSAASENHRHAEETEE